VIFLSEHYDKEDDTKPDYSTRVDTIGSAGLYLYFDVKMKSCTNGKCASYSTAQQGILWPYSEMKNVLKTSGSKGTGLNEGAPQKGKFKYLVGKGGIAYDPTTNKCGDIVGDPCGEEPHTGYVFTFDYEWVDDADTKMFD
jgi:hypothetical protein